MTPDDFWAELRTALISFYEGILKVRLAAAGCLLTAVALELSAGQARAAELTRTQGNPTTSPPQPAARAARADQASNLKSPSVAFGISRPTRTPTRHHRGGEAVDRGLD